MSEGEHSVHELEQGKLRDAYLPSSQARALLISLRRQCLHWFLPFLPAQSNQIAGCA
jgi:hypothetical protein